VAAGPASLITTRAAARVSWPSPVDDGAGDQAIRHGERADLAAQPDLAAAVCDRRGQRRPQAAGSARAEAEPLERALAGEVGQEHPGRKLVQADREDRPAHAAEDAVHRLVPGEAGQPVGGRELAIGQPLVPARLGQPGQHPGAVPGEPGQQEAPASPGDVDVPAADPVQDRRVGRPDVELGAGFGEGLLGDAAGLDHDGAVVDLEAVDVAGGGPAAEVAESLGDQRAVAEAGQPGRGHQPARARADHDDVEIHGGLLIRLGQAEAVAGHVVQHHLPADRGGAHQPGDEPQVG
jgi:hypothetical protein